ncbi:hypothetical protein CMI37_38440 [Candidatus Pacearchaeota archaeon]|nr:hypothetical protein [Candidatus Pacearchaeota archaeon]|tara:strand:+ start:2393 stop:2632 length:240 start_codon:yes stop_codon:yes gene_type:complete
MTPKKRRELIDKLKELLRSKGYVEDKFGNFKMSEKLRYKFNPNALRKEVRLISGEWMRVRSGFYKDLVVTEEGKIQGMR